MLEISFVVDDFEEVFISSYMYMYNGHVKFLFNSTQFCNLIVIIE